MPSPFDHLTGEERAAAIMAALAPLIGRWRGAGAVAFPGIESVAYSEESQFYSNGVDLLLHFEQRTWRLGPQGAPTSPLHWECGFFRPLEDGGIEFTNTQGNGRMEILRGTLDPEHLGEGRVLLRLESSFLGNDPRMVRTARSFLLDGDRLHYEARMATTRVGEMRRHLDATLKRETLAQAPRHETHARIT